MAAPDTWESLQSPPFPFGTSAGGGLAADGQFIYAADFSGDADDDFIDLNDNGTMDGGESLGDRGIPNGSVRFARYAPGTDSWASLPTLSPGGVGGDSFSSGNLNRPLFCAGGYLYYYQLRAGPYRCVLYRYDLSSAPGGAWEQVWDKSTGEALIDGNAGMVGVDAPGGPVILHHRGGGAYEFVRTSALDSGGSHVLLTPDWPFGGAHFPRNGSWEFDSSTGRLYHMSGNQLLRWSPSASYDNASFLISVPVEGAPLAVFQTVIGSLRDTLGWNPGGSETNPGASLWGSSLTMVGEASGVLEGPNGQDTGNHVLYMVRGESSESGWPFNEGRGRADNAGFARYFPDSDATQTLSAPPFLIGKGSGTAYLGGFLYLIQGETRPGTGAAVSGADGIRIPGAGFARFVLRTDASGDGPLRVPVGDYLQSGFATLSASPHSAGDPEDIFDGDWGAGCTSDGVNPMVVTLSFNSPVSAGAARAAFSPDTHQWSLEAANSTTDLDGKTGSHVDIFGPLEAGGDGPHWREWNDTPVERRIFRFTVRRMAGGDSVEIKELELQYAKTVHTIEINGTPVRVNHMEIVPDTDTLIVGESHDLMAELSLSLGPDRYDVTGDAVWTSASSAVATVAGGTVQGVGVGETTVDAAFDPFGARARVQVIETPAAHDEDFSVAWIQRLPVTDWVWDSPHPETDGWPTAGSQVTWRARIRNWWPYPWEGVSWRCLVDGEVVDQGTVDLAADGYTDVDVPWTWNFDRHALRFEIDPTDEIDEFSEQNNAVETWTDAVTVAFWVEQSVFDYFHQYQKDLGIGSNGWEDWAQRQVAHWGEMFEAAQNPVDAPGGVLDRIRLDKITVVPDGALPLNGGLPTNNPDNNDRTTDLVWGFPSTLLGGGMYSNHTDAVLANSFYYEGSLLHELGHARYLVDVYGFNVMDSEEKHRVLLTLNGGYVAGTPYMPRTWQWWDHVFYFSGWDRDSSFQGLMNSHHLKIDRYSAAALNLIAGHRATRGNCNAPGNIGEFLNDLPDENTLQLVDWRGEPIPNAAVSAYHATEASGDWYGKTFDDTADATFTGNASGLVDVGRNPFTSSGDIRHTYGISNAIAILRVDAGGKTGFAFLPSAYFNLEYWRGHRLHGYYELRVPMIGDTPSIADVVSWPDGGGRRFRIIARGPTAVVGVSGSSRAVRANRYR